MVCRPSSAFEITPRGEAALRRGKHRCRRGVASLEFMMGFPILMLLLTVVFTMAGLFLAHCDASINARWKAWRGRRTPWRNSNAFRRRRLPMAPVGDYARIFGGRFLISPRMAVQAEHEANIPILTPALQGRFRPARREHWTMGGSWDWRELPFESRGQHPRLRPTERIRVFHAGYPMNAFHALAAFASTGALNQLSAARSAHQQADRQHGEANRRRRARLQQNIQRLEGEQRQWESRLRSLEAADPPDDDAIAAARRRLSAIRRELGVLRDALANLNAAAHTMPGGP